MGWTPSFPEILDRLGSGLYAGYVGTGSELRWPGERPGRAWHAHGWIPKNILIFRDLHLTIVTVLRRRWLLAGTTRTIISRAPDEVGRLTVAVTLVVLKLWGLLAGVHGVHDVTEVHEALDDRPAPRTVLRWLKAALPGAAWTEQRFREIFLDKCEPRPAEQLFPGGLSPPDGLRRKRWNDPANVCRLYRGLLWLTGGAVRLKVSLPVLLAEARGRWPDPANTALI